MRRPVGLWIERPVGGPVHIHRDRKGKGKDGQDRTYVSVVHSTWEATTAGKKRAKPEVFARLGREETLDVGVV